MPRLGLGANLGVVMSPPEEEFSNTHSLDFDGTDDYVGFTMANDFSSGAFSISVWAKFNNAANGSSHQALVSKSSTGNSAFFVGVLSNGKLRFYMRDSGGTGFSVETTGSAFSDDTWYHIVATMASDDTANIYVDGDAVRDPKASSPRTNNGDIRIGEANDSYWGCIDGFIDEVTIWSSELSSSNVTTLYNSGTPNDASAQGISGLLSYFKLDNSNADEEEYAGSVTTNSSPAFSTDVPPN